MIWHRRLALLHHLELLSHLASHQFLSNIRMAIEQSDATAFPARKLAQMCSMARPEVRMVIKLPRSLTNKCYQRLTITNG